MRKKSKEKKKAKKSNQTRTTTNILQIIILLKWIKYSSAGLLEADWVLICYVWMCCWRWALLKRQVSGAWPGRMCLPACASLLPLFPGQHGVKSFLQLRPFLHAISTLASANHGLKLVKLWAKNTPLLFYVAGVRCSTTVMGKWLKWSFVNKNMRKSLAAETIFRKWG